MAEDIITILNKGKNRSILDIAIILQYHSEYCAFIIDFNLGKILSQEIYKVHIFIEVLSFYDQILYIKMPN